MRHVWQNRANACKYLRTSATPDCEEVGLLNASIYVFSYFPFGFEGMIWDLIVSVPDHCLSFYFP